MEVYEFYVLNIPSNNLHLIQVKIKGMIKGSAINNFGLNYDYIWFDSLEVSSDNDYPLYCKI